ncbi:hypothetical protein [Cribrihabitans pelagius]|uniref:hypothetical protein n=1 Tax=Cribrihabitans pelagius TaxID=1765746 RepID=UPI003B5B284C
MAVPRKAIQSIREKPSAGGRSGLRIEAVSAPGNIRIGLAASAPQGEQAAAGQGANATERPCDADGSAAPGRALQRLVLAAAVLMFAAGALAYLVPPSGTPGAPQAAASAPEQAGDALVARITAGTLAALRTPRSAGPQPAAAAPPAPLENGSPLYRMVATAAAQGQSQTYIDRMVNAAYAADEVSVPAVLIGADGQVDTATLLALFTSR